MYAVILTYDAHIGLAQLLYKIYMKLWPECPFIFRIPYQEEGEATKFFKEQSNVELIKTDVKIYKTIESLLVGLNDEDWVYWGTSDRVPILNFSFDQIKEVYNHVISNKFPPETTNVFFHKRFLLSTLDNPIVYNDHRGFWGHHFAKVKMLRKLIETKMVTPIDCPLFLGNKNICKSVFIETNCIRFRETTINKKILNKSQKLLSRFNCQSCDVSEHEFIDDLVVHTITYKKDFIPEEGFDPFAHNKNKEPLCMP